MREIPVAGGYMAKVDDVDFPQLNKSKWHIHRSGRNLYAVSRLGGRNEMMHRVILCIKKGEGTVDHIDGDGLNNQRANLRIVSHSVNMRNRAHHRVNKFALGTTECNGSYKAQIWIDGKTRYIGIFKTQKAAHEAFKKADRLNGKQ